MDGPQNFGLRRRPSDRCGHYRLIRTIGKGNFSTVKLAEHEIAKKKVAIKIIDKSKIDAENLGKIHREMRILKSLRHQHIVKLYEVMESDRLLYMVMEYAGGGEVYEHLIKEGRLAESSARRLFRQVVSAVAYCHSTGIVHRDLKAENLLLDRWANIKLVDFGFSNFYSGAHLLSTWCGSPPYAAPELFLGQDYDGTKADVWSLGVVLYIMVSGGFPFPNSSIDKLRRSVLAGKFQIPYFVSIECADLIRKMLVLNVNKRCTLQQVIQHRWFAHPESWSEIDSVMKESLKPVLYAEQPTEPLNNTVLLYIQQRTKWTNDRIIEACIEKRFDAMYATYHLLCDKLKKLNERELSSGLTPSDLDNQPRRGSRGSITTGQANLDPVQENVAQISASDLVKLSLNASSDEESGSSDADSTDERTVASERRTHLAPPNTHRRHTLCVPGAPPQLLTPHLLFPVGAQRPETFPLQLGLGFGAVAQLPLIQPAIGLGPPLLNPLFDVWSNRRSSDGEAMVATEQSGACSASHSAASSQFLPTAQHLIPSFMVHSNEHMDNPSIEEQGANYLRQKGSWKRRTFDSGMSHSHYLSSPSSSYSTPSNQRYSRKAVTPHTRRASSPLQLSSQQMGQLDKIYNQGIGGRNDSTGSASGVTQLQREFAQLRATAEKQAAAGMSSGAAPALDMIAEQEMENGGGVNTRTPSISITPDPVTLFEQQAHQIVHGGAWQPSFNQYYYANIPVVPLVAEPSSDVQSILSPCAITQIVAELKRVLDGKQIQYAEDGLAPDQPQHPRRLSLENDDGTKVEIGVSPVSEAECYQSKVDFRCVEGNWLNYKRLCSELIKGIKL